jgi:hypothetical protein
VASSDGGLSSRLDRRLNEAEEGEGVRIEVGRDLEVGVVPLEIEGGGEVYKVVSSVIRRISHFFL